MADVPGRGGICAGGQQGAQSHDALQPEKWRRVEFGPAGQAQGNVGQHPERYKKQDETKKSRLSDDTTEAFHKPLPVADLLLFARVELQNRFDILADLVAFGLRRCAPRIGRQGWR